MDLAAQRIWEGVRVFQAGRGAREQGMQVGIRADVEERGGDYTGCVRGAEVHSDGSGRGDEGGAATQTLRVAFISCNPNCVIEWNNENIFFRIPSFVYLSFLSHAPLFKRCSFCLCEALNGKISPNVSHELI
jgi:hypothetical protein